VNRATGDRVAYYSSVAVGWFARVRMSIERQRRKLIKKTFLLASIYFITCLECLIDVINGILLENLAETARRKRMQ
jgi:hypothetical protein